MAKRKGDYRLQVAGLAYGGLLRGDASYPSHVFHRVMDKTDRDDFDKALVDMKHPLAYEAGTQEGRFVKYVAELATALADGAAMMTDFQKTQAANAAIVRYRLTASTHARGRILSTHNGVEKFRPVRVNVDGSIEVWITYTWLPAYVDPTGMRALTVR